LRRLVSGERLVDGGVRLHHAIWRREREHHLRLVRGSGETQVAAVLARRLARSINAPSPVLSMKLTLARSIT
jgi:hypothetical protein